MVKKIHYCWFGGNPLPEEAVACIDSWKKFFPDYEIIQWDETNFDVFKIPYIKEAYEQKKYAFVSDYARFDILFQYGGLYFDVDVEVIKPMDKILEYGPYMGAEIDGDSLGKKTAVNPGLGFAAEPNMQFLKDIIEVYNTLHFVNNDGTLNQKTIVEYTTELLLKYGLEDCDKIQNVAEFKIYPSEFFCPINYYTGDYRATENTYSIHHYKASWMSDADKKKHDEIVRLSKKMGRKIARKYVLMKYAFSENGIKGVYSLIKKKIGRG